MFAWRSIRGAIATRENLARRGMEVDTRCLICGDEIESTLHMVAKCEEARLIWYTSPLRLKAENYDGSNFREWCLSVHKTCKDLSWWSLFWSIAWGIWLRRNGWTFSKKLMVVQEVIGRAASLIGEFNLAKEVSSINPPAMVLDATWKPPPLGMIKVNSDAAKISNSAVGFGGVMCDNVGDVVVSTCLKMEGAFEVDVMEAMAMRHALQITLESGFSTICLETDCLKLFSHLKKATITSNAFGVIVNDILNLSRSCQVCSFSFVKRTGNQVAHSLAKLCNIYSDLRVWLEDYPYDVTQFVLADLSHFVA
ncbi:uncharacterized protein LOC110693947 [Chenopodium quinoa]|uniref:uncharacterized protein LOC110693947 n=1 Tax=Chenopodium quinoa TaxID=63459 RepID=UPI000B7933E4|nr:uncharacterized protein LOC110693947 [Chenopodium quinoa]